MSLSIGAECVTAAHTSARALDQALAEPVQNGPLLHGIAFAVQNGTEHQIGGGPHPVKQTPAGSVDPLKNRVDTQKSAGCLTVIAVEILLDLFQDRMLVGNSLSEMLKPLDDLAGGMDPEFIEIIIDGVLIEADCVIVLAHPDKSLHGQGLPVGQRSNDGSILSQFLHALIVLEFAEDLACILYTVRKNLSIAHGLPHSPDIIGLHGQELAAVFIAGLQVTLKPLPGVCLLAGLYVEFLKFIGILFHFDLIGPVKRVLFRDDVVYPWKSCLFQIFFCIINNAAQRVMRIIDLSVSEEKFFKAVPCHTLFA